MKTGNRSLIIKESGKQNIRFPLFIFTKKEKDYLSPPSQA